MYTKFPLDYFHLYILPIIKHYPDNIFECGTFWPPMLCLYNKLCIGSAHNNVRTSNVNIAQISNVSNFFEHKLYFIFI